MEIRSLIKTLWLRSKDQYTNPDIGFEQFIFKNKRQIRNAYAHKMERLVADFKKKKKSYFSPSFFIVVEIRFSLGFIFFLPISQIRKNKRHGSSHEGEGTEILQH